MADHHCNRQSCSFCFEETDKELSRLRAAHGQLQATYDSICAEKDRLFAENVEKLDRYRVALEKISKSCYCQAWPIAKEALSPGGKP